MNFHTILWNFSSIFHWRSSPSIHTGHTTVLLLCFGSESFPFAILLTSSIHDRNIDVKCLVPNHILDYTQALNRKSHFKKVIYFLCRMFHVDTCSYFRSDAEKILFRLCVSTEQKIQTFCWFVTSHQHNENNMRIQNSQ